MIVKREGLTPERATKEDWQGIIEEFTGKIKSEIGENIISNLESKAFQVDHAEFQKK